MTTRTIGNPRRASRRALGTARRREGADAPQRELARLRQALPWVRVDKDYRFVTDDGERTLTDLFDGRSQLLRASRAPLAQIDAYKRRYRG